MCVLCVLACCACACIDVQVCTSLHVCIFVGLCGRRKPPASLYQHLAAIISKIMPCQDVEVLPIEALSVIAEASFVCKKRENMLEKKSNDQTSTYSLLLPPAEEIIFDSNL